MIRVTSFSCVLGVLGIRDGAGSTSELEPLEGRRERRAHDRTLVRRLRGVLDPGIAGASHGVDAELASGALVDQLGGRLARDRMNGVLGHANSP